MGKRKLYETSQLKSILHYKDILFLNNKNKIVRLKYFLKISLYLFFILILVQDYRFSENEAMYIVLKDSVGRTIRKPSKTYNHPSLTVASLLITISVRCSVNVNMQFMHMSSTEILLTQHFW